MQEDLTEIKLLVQDHQRLARIELDKLDEETKKLDRCILFLKGAFEELE